MDMAQLYCAMIMDRTFSLTFCLLLFYICMFDACSNNEDVVKRDLRNKTNVYLEETNIVDNLGRKQICDDTNNNRRNEKTDEIHNCDNTDHAKPTCDDTCSDNGKQKCDNMKIERPKDDKSNIEGPQCGEIKDKEPRCNDMRSEDVKVHGTDIELQEGGKRNSAGLTFNATEIDFNNLRLTPDVLRTADLDRYLRFFNTSDEIDRMINILRRIEEKAGWTSSSTSGFNPCDDCCEMNKTQIYPPRMLNTEDDWKIIVQKPPQLVPNVTCRSIGVPGTICDVENITISLLVQNDTNPNHTYFDSFRVRGFCRCIGNF